MGDSPACSHSAPNGVDVCERTHPLNQQPSSALTAPSMDSPAHEYPAPNGVDVSECKHLLSQQHSSAITAPSMDSPARAHSPPNGLDVSERTQRQPLVARSNFSESL